MKYSLFIGRYQPFHEGHKALIQSVLNEDRNVCIALRDTPISSENPYTIEERRAMIEKEFPARKCDLEGCEHGTNCEFMPQVKIITIPDIEEVCWGRDVGWGRREIRLDESTEAISATRIRNKLK